MRPYLLLSLLLAALFPAADADAQLRRRRDRAADRSAERSSDVHQLTHGGRSRSYVLRVPERARRAMSAGTAVPLVIALHGGGGNARNAEQMTGFTRLAAREGFLVAYPDGTSRGRTPLLTWNAGHCCGAAMEDKVDDVGFLDALIDAVQGAHRVDSTRMYVTGMSNGAMMTHRAGIELSHRIAAIAPVVGTVFGDEAAPRAPVSAIIFNGMRDESVPFEGGPPGGVGARAWDGTPARPAEAQAAFWARAGGCNATPGREDRGGYVLTRHDCPASVAVELYAVKDGGHAWPGGRAGSRRGDAPGSAVDATEVIWTFFKTHPRR
jgi:polyhydroxybutyrate depolymerase